MRGSRGLVLLIESNAPYWAAEAEIVRSYWDSPGRSVATDRTWLLRQAYKEYWDGFMPPFERIATARIDHDVPRAEALALLATAREELAHYCAFAEVYERLAQPGAPPLDPERLKRDGDWPENVSLVRLRGEHKRAHGELGRRAHRFTEGGYCTLYAEGMRLRGRGGIDDAIAAACAQVHDDEFGHMLEGIAGLDDAGLGAEGFERLAELTVAQMRLRLHMRNAQFGFPVGEPRLAELLAGHADPLPFDWDKASERSERAARRSRA